LVSEKKIRFEIFPDIDMDEWQEQLEEFRQEHEGKADSTQINRKLTNKPKDQLK